MKFASVRLVTLDVERLIAFYTQLSGVAAVRLADGFAEIRFPGATLAISAEHLIQRFNAGAAPAAANRSAILEFEVDEIDRVMSSLGSAAVIVQEPTVMPWGESLPATEGSGWKPSQCIFPAPCLVQEPGSLSANKARAAGRIRRRRMTGIGKVVSKLD